MTARSVIVRVLPIVLSAAAGIVVVRGQQTSTPGSLAEQVRAGRAAYLENCSRHATETTSLDSKRRQPCGGPTSRPRGAIGPRAISWRYIQGSMPPDRSRLGEDTNLAIVAYILDSNGAPAGAQALTAATAQPVGPAAAKKETADQSLRRAVPRRSRDTSTRPSAPPSACAGLPRSRSATP